MVARAFLICLLAANISAFAETAPDFSADFSNANACSISGNCGRPEATSSGNLGGAALGCAMIFGSAWLRRRRGA